MTDKLNRLLPPDISVYRLRAVKPDAHARFDATARMYKYYVTTAKMPFNRQYRCRLFQTPDFERMNEAAQTLFDYTDFTSFSKLHTDVKTNNCKIMHAAWTRVDDVTWVFTIQADRFLRNMVRAIVGTLLEVGRGKLSVEGFRRVIEQKDRCQAGTSGSHVRRWRLPSLRVVVRMFRPLGGSCCAGNRLVRRKASAFSARRGTGPATPKAMRTRSKVFLSGLSRALTEVPRVAMSMALRMAYLI